MFFSKEIKEVKECQTFTIKKKWRSQNLSEKFVSRRENLKKYTGFEEQNVTRYIRENVYFGIIVFSCLSSTKSCLRFLLICFAREIKGFYQSSLGNEVDFRDIMNVSPNIVAKKIKFLKIETWFCRWKSTDNYDIDIFLSLENPCTIFTCEGKDLKTHF